MGRPLNILWVPHAPWHVPQREKYLLKYLSQTHQVYATDWDADFRGIGDYCTGRYLKNFGPRQFQDDGVTIYHVPRISPALFFSQVRKYNDTLYHQWIERIVERHRVDWIIGSFVVPYQDFGVPVTIDVCDDNVAYWLEAGGHRDYADEIGANEDSWLQHSRHVTVISSVLGERLKARMTSQIPTAVVPNGVDLGVFTPAENKDAVKVALGLDPRHRYIGCIGSFNRSGEVNRLVAVARRIQHMASVRLLLVGAGRYLTLMQRQIAHERLDNVIFAGFHQGERLLQYFQATDVGLCPYPVTYGLHASSPLRLLQYSAVGATVVIPELEAVQRMAFSNVLLSQESDDDFAKTATLALDADSHVPTSIDRYHWRTLAERLVRLMAPRQIHDS